MFSGYKKLSMENNKSNHSVHRCHEKKSRRILQVSGKLLLRAGKSVDIFVSVVFNPVFLIRTLNIRSRIFQIRRPQYAHNRKIFEQNHQKLIFDTNCSKFCQYAYLHRYNLISISRYMSKTQISIKSRKSDRDQVAEISFIFFYRVNEIQAYPRNILIQRLYSEQIIFTRLV